MARTGPNAAGWRGAVAGTLAEATGRDSRKDPHVGGTGGPAGNARITAWTGVVLLALSVGELVTLLDIEGLISWHLVLGGLLLPPSLIKTGSTGWRIARYYTGSREYRAAGPPPMPLRILGPFVVAATLGLLASGIVLVALGPDRSQSRLLTVVGQRLDWVTVHQGFFLVWAVLAGLHVLGRLLPAVGIVVTRPAAGHRVDGRGARTAVLAATAGLAALTAVLLLGAGSGWRSGTRGLHGRDGLRGHLGASAGRHPVRAAAAARPAA